MTRCSSARWQWPLPARASGLDVGREGTKAAVLSPYPDQGAALLATQLGDGLGEGLVQGDEPVV